MCKWTISLKNNLVICDALFILLHGIKCVIFKNRFTTTKIELWLQLVQANPKTKSMLMSFQESYSISSWVYNWCCKFEMQANDHRQVIKILSLGTDCGLPVYEQQEVISMNQNMENICESKWNKKIKLKDGKKLVHWDNSRTSVSP